MRHEVAVSKPVRASSETAYEVMSRILDRLVLREPPYDRMALTIGRSSIPIVFEVKHDSEESLAEIKIQAAAARRAFMPRFDGTVRVRTMHPVGAQLELNGIYEMPVANSADAGELNELRDSANKALESMVAWFADEIMAVVLLTPERFIQRRKASSSEPS